MQHYAIYNAANGEIVRSGFCPEKMASLQVREGESIVLGQGHDIDDKVVVGDNGIASIVRRTDAEIATRREASGFPVEAAAARYRAKGINPQLALRLARKAARPLMALNKVTPTTS